MEVLLNIPFSLDARSLIERARIEPGSEDAAEIERLVKIAEQEGRPKAVYTEAFIESREDDAVLFGGVLFRSRMLSLNLQAAERVFPYVATCGRELDEAYPADGDMLKEFWRDMVKNDLLNAACQYLNDHLQRRFRLGKMSAMHPGSGDAAVWPIEQQKELFSLLGDVETEIGVKLTDSFLMVPNKTVSGISFPDEKDFRSCQVCRREGCPSRSAEFDRDLWADMQRF